MTRGTARRRASPGSRSLFRRPQRETPASGHPIQGLPWFSRASGALHAQCRAMRGRMISVMTVPVLVVPRAGFSIEEPWAIPPECDLVPLLRAIDGGVPRLQTAVAAYHDGEMLTIVFQCDDD